MPVKGPVVVAKPATGRGRETYDLPDESDEEEYTEVQYCGPTGTQPSKAAPVYIPILKN